VLVVWKLDRLGRNMINVLQLIEHLTERGISFRSVTEGLHTDGPMGKAVLTVMAAFAQLERDTMIERTRAGAGTSGGERLKGWPPSEGRRRQGRQRATADGEGDQRSGYRQDARGVKLRRHPPPPPSMTGSRPAVVSPD
jgi:DNA invertase Pin-like site-specific DNA recombinase